MKNVVACFFALAATGVVPAPVDYRFDEVKRNVTLTTASQEMKVDRGARAHGGDKVNTGLFSYALIAADQCSANGEHHGSGKERPFVPDRPDRCDASQQDDRELDPEDDRRATQQAAAEHLACGTTE